MILMVRIQNYEELSKDVRLSYRKREETEAGKFIYRDQKYIVVKV